MQNPIIEETADQTALRVTREALDRATRELVTARRDRETMQATLNASPATVDHPMVTMFQRIIENMVESHFDGPGADQLERMVDSTVDLALESALSDLSVEVESIATVRT
tara:strand:- start:107 stop:436 length:330 start_codon:yes stop_codon:yes gene_type:complete